MQRSRSRPRDEPDELDARRRRCRDAARACARAGTRPARRCGRGRRGSSRPARACASGRKKPSARTPRSPPDALAHVAGDPAGDADVAAHEHAVARDERAARADRGRAEARVRRVGPEVGCAAAKARRARVREVAALGVGVVVEEHGHRELAGPPLAEGAGLVARPAPVRPWCRRARRTARRRARRSAGARPRGRRSSTARPPRPRARGRRRPRRAARARRG